MTGDRRQRRDGSAKRVQLTSGDHGGPKEKRKGKKPKTAKPSMQHKKASAKKEWKALFARLAEVKKRDAERQQRRAAGG